jgi:hypothetical protein
MGCRYVKDCTGYPNCDDTQLECECGACGRTRPGKPGVHLQKSLSRRQKFAPSTCECLCGANCEAPKTKQNEDTCACECPESCPSLDAPGKTVQNPDTCDCECPDDPCGDKKHAIPTRAHAHALTRVQMSAKSKILTRAIANARTVKRRAAGRASMLCTNGFTRKSNDPACGCECADPNLLLQSGDCVPCPKDTHVLCDGKCVPVCPAPFVRSAPNCDNCVCGPDTVFVDADPNDPNSVPRCVPVTYGCINDECVALNDGTGNFSTLTACNRSCGSGTRSAALSDLERAARFTDSLSGRRHANRHHAVPAIRYCFSLVERRASLFWQLM